MKNKIRKLLKPLKREEMKDFGGVFLLTIVMTWIFFQQKSFTVSIEGLLFVIGYGFISTVYFFHVLFTISNRNLPLIEFTFIAITLTAGVPISLFGAFYYNSGVLNGTFSGVEEAFYFSATTFTTLGLGNISPSTTLERVATSVEAVFGYIFLGALLALFMKTFSNRIN